MNTIKKKRGGRRRGSGRKKGAATIRTRATADRIIASGVTPLEFMIARMREPKPARRRVESGGAYDLRVQAWKEQGFEAAKASAPYIHPRLATVEHSGTDGDPIKHSITVEFVGPD